jgi:hypothetical protein
VHTSCNKYVYIFCCLPPSPPIFCLLDPWTDIFFVFIFVFVCLFVFFFLNKNKNYCLHSPYARIPHGEKVYLVTLRGNYFLCPHELLFCAQNPILSVKSINLDGQSDNGL